MLCPICRAPLHEESLHGHAIDRCGVCRGLWFDDTELSGVLSEMPVGERVVATIEAPPETLPCPNCGREMQRREYAQDSGVPIHRCDTCQGTWLQAGRLEQLARYRAGTPAQQRLAVAMGARFRSEDRWRRARELLRARWASGAVAAIYFVVFAFATGGDGETLLRLAEFLLLPMGCIWFCDGWARVSAYSFGGTSRATPSDFVALGGWLLLVTPAALAVWLRFAAR